MPSGWAFKSASLAIGITNLFKGQVRTGKNLFTFFTISCVVGSTCSQINKFSPDLTRPVTETAQESAAYKLFFFVPLPIAWHWNRSENF